MLRRVNRMAATSCRIIVMKIIVPPKRDFYQESCLAEWSIYLTYLHLRCQYAERFRAVRGFLN